MKAELQQRLFAKFPAVFRQRDWPVTQSNMAFGIECGDGWFRILDEMLEAIRKSGQRVQATQIKEKFGTLRFYYIGGDDDINDIVRIAEMKSAHTCEECGKPGKLNTSGWWISCLCDSCRERSKQ